MKLSIKFLLILTLAVFLSAACSLSPPEVGGEGMSNMPPGRLHGHADTQKSEIAPSALYEKLRIGEKIVLLDVREQNEYEEVHIPGTTQRISQKEISAQTLENAGIRKNDEIIVYCRSGNRSRLAAQKMRELGYLNVWELNSGIIHWIEDGLPTESGASAGAITQQNPVQIAGPSIAFDRLDHDFGEVRQFGGNVSTTFRVRNEGSANLTVGTITTSCACTTATIQNLLIPPNGESVIAVAFNPNLHEEPRDKFKRTIFIPTNDPENPEAELTVHIDILEGQ